MAFPSSEKSSYGLNSLLQVLWIHLTLRSPHSCCPGLPAVPATCQQHSHLRAFALLFSLPGTLFPWVSLSSTILPPTFPMRSSLTTLKYNPFSTLSTCVSLPRQHIPPSHIILYCLCPPPAFLSTPPEWEIHREEILVSFVAQCLG